MNAKWMIFAMVVAAPVLVAAGCSTYSQRVEGPVMGTVEVYPGPANSAINAHTIMVSINGKDKPLSDLYDDATLVILSDTPCVANTVGLSRSASWLPPNVSVLEVSTGPETCGEANECAMSRGDAGKRIVSLCDSRDLLRKTYGVGPGPIILLLDRDGAVRSRGLLSDFDFLRLRAEDLARQAAVDRESLMNDYSGFPY